MTDLSGQSIGRYRLLAPLGEGGMATVYKALDTRLERDVAIKLIRHSAFPAEMHDKILARFEREAKSLARLSHPNIVKVHDYGEYEGAPYLVLEYLAGGDLKQRLTGQPLDWHKAFQLILPIARALKFSHQQGIIHRDVKPSNILFTISDEPMLSDFGIAKILEYDEAATLTGTGVGVGTPGYMAPEQWTGETSPQSDQYGLGVVLYELLTGRKPYEADTPAGILIKQTSQPLPPPRQFVPDMPVGAEQVLLKTLARDPAERYAEIGSLIEALENLLVEPVRVQPIAKPAPIKAEPEIIPQNETAPAHQMMASIDEQTVFPENAPPPPGQPRQSDTEPPASTVKSEEQTKDTLIIKSQRRSSKKRPPSFVLFGLIALAVVVLFYGVFALWGGGPAIASPETTASTTLAETSASTAPASTPVLRLTSIPTNLPTSLPTLTATAQPTPLGGGMLVFANGELGRQDMYAVQGDGEGLTRLTSQSGYIGYRWSGCGCSGERVSGFSYAMNLSPDQKYIYYYYAPLGERKLRVINAETLETIVDVRSPYGSSFGWSPDGKYVAYTEYAGNTLEYISVVSNDGQTRIKIAEGPRFEELTWSPDGGNLFYKEYACREVKGEPNQWGYYNSAYSDCSVILFGTGIGSQAQQKFSLPITRSGAPINSKAAVSRQGSLLAIPNSKEVKIFDYQIGQEIQTIPYPLKLQGIDISKQPFWDTDGKLLLLVDNPYTKKEELYEEISGEFLAVTNETKIRENMPGEKSTWYRYPLIYLGQDGQKREVFVRDADVQTKLAVEGLVIEVKDLLTELDLPTYKFEWTNSWAWSPDRSEVALILTKDNTRAAIVIYSLQTGQARKLGEPANYSQVTWSPDGLNLAYISQNELFGTALYVTDLNGQNIQKVASTSEKDLTGLFWVPFWNTPKP